MADLEKIADSLSSLTILEASELTKILEEKWGVSAAAQVAVAAAPAGVCCACRWRSARHVGCWEGARYDRMRACGGSSV